MPRVTLSGNPEAVAKKAVEKLRDSIDSKMREALDAAIRILDSARIRALERVEREVSQILREAEEKVHAERAVRETEIRVAELNARNEWIERAVREALKRLRGALGEEEYTAFLRDMLRRAAESLKAMDISEGVVYPTEPDRDIVEKLVATEKLPVTLRVADRSVEGLGGFIVASPDETTRLDYRLESVLADAIEDARAAAAKQLFG